MPFVQVVGGELRERAIEIHKKAESDEPYDVAYRHGFFEALRALLPSETVGMLIMDCDMALEGDELFTDSLPRLVVSDDA